MMTNGLAPARLRVIDSHTGGEPTRVVPVGEISLAGSTMREKLESLSGHDHLRTGILLEPRGSDALVGAILTPPVNPSSIAGIIFFNNGGYLGMCGHGTIGVVETLRHLGELSPGSHRFDTPVGTVEAELLEDGTVSLQNVPAKRHLNGVRIEIDDNHELVGDVAYGGNWFFIAHEPPFELHLKNEPLLRQFCTKVKARLIEKGITGETGALIDHIELSAPGTPGKSDSINYVLCPGDAYDRSPCGTGTSAKLACLYEDGALETGEWYVQESITGSTFRGKIDLIDGQFRPTIVGRAWVTGESTLLFGEDDPLRWGIV